MKIKFGVSLFIFSFCILFICPSCSRKNEKEESKSIITEKDNPYLELRNKALTVHPEDLNISLPDKDIFVYGVVMDWEINGTIVTTVAYNTGDASMYFSSGGGIIGGGAHKNINAAARLFVEKAAATVNLKSTITEKMPLPVKDYVAFYVLSNKGIYAEYEKLQNLESHTSPLTALFGEGNNLITELRTINPE